MKLKKIISVYAVVNLVFLLVVVPWHIHTAKMAQDILYRETKNICINAMENLDGELKNMSRFANIIEGDSTYAILEKSRGELSVIGYSYLSDLYRMYANYVGTNYTLKDAVFLFQYNDLAMMRDYCFGDAEIGFDTLFRFRGMDYHELKRYIFEDRSGIGKFVYDRELYYNGETQPALVYFMPVAENSRTGDFSCMMLVLTVEDILKATGLQAFSDEIDFYVRTADGTVCLAEDGVVNETDKTITYRFWMQNAVFGINLEKQYYHARIPYLNLIWGYYIFVFAGAVFLTVLMFKTYRKPLVQLIGMLHDTENEAVDIAIGGEFEMASELITKEKNRSMAAENLVLENYILNFFSAPITEGMKKEFSEIVPWGEKPFVMMVLSAKQDVSDYVTEMLDELELGHVFSVVDNHANTVLFLSDEHLDEKFVRKTAGKILEYLDGVKEFKAGVSRICADITEGFEAYTDTLESMRFLDIGDKLIYTFDIEKDTVPGRQENDSMLDEKLYHYISAGDAQNACRIVFEQWYNLISNPCLDESIEQKFFKQRGIIARVAMEKGKKVFMPKYSKLKNINDLAFVITDIVSELCAEIEKIKANNSETEAILEYIDAHFTSCSFGLTELEDTFRMSSKTISKIIREAVGKKFTEYVEQKRVELAKELLRTTECGSNEIMLKCGFTNESSFYRSFRKIVGMTPAVYREAYNVNN